MLREGSLEMSFLDLGWGCYVLGLRAFHPCLPIVFLGVQYIRLFRDRYLGIICVPPRNVRDDPLDR